jgi:hypothetical protein
MVLAAIPMDGQRHSGEILKEKICHCLTLNGLSMDKLVCAVRDDASNIQAATNALDKDRLIFRVKLKKN